MPFKDSCPDKVAPDGEVLVGGDIKYLTQSSHPHDIVDLLQTTTYLGEKVFDHSEQRQRLSFVTNLSNVRFLCEHSVSSCRENAVNTSASLSDYQYLIHTDVNVNPERFE